MNRSSDGVSREVLSRAFERLSPLERSLLDFLCYQEKEPLLQEASSLLHFEGGSVFLKSIAPTIMTSFFSGKKLYLDSRNLEVAPFRAILEAQDLVSFDPSTSQQEIRFVEKDGLLQVFLKKEGTFFLLRECSSISLEEAEPYLAKVLLLKRGFDALLHSTKGTFSERLAEEPLDFPSSFLWPYLDPVVSQKAKEKLIEKEPFSPQDEKIERYFAGQGVTREEAYLALRELYALPKDPLSQVADFEHRRWIVGTLFRFGKEGGRHERFEKMTFQDFADAERTKHPPRAEEDLARLDYDAYLILHSREE